MTAAPLDGARVLAVLVARRGQPPVGGPEVAAEALEQPGGAVLVVGDGAGEAATSLDLPGPMWWSETGPGLLPGALSAALARPLRGIPLLLLPSSPDGRDLAPRLAARLDRPLLAAARSVRLLPGLAGAPPLVHAELSRLEDRLMLPVDVPAPAVATLVPGVRDPRPEGWAPGATGRDRHELALPPAPEHGARDVETLAVLDPEPATMDLAEAPRVLGGGAGLVPSGVGEPAGRAIFDLLAAVAAGIGASAGATRVVTDAGWIGHDRQIGTTGVEVSPVLYIALGISGATQHVGGLGNPRHVVSVNTDGSCPMTAMADLGLVTDALGLLRELAGRFGVEVPDAVPAARVEVQE